MRFGGNRGFEVRVIIQRPAQRLSCLAGGMSRGRVLNPLSGNKIGETGEEALTRRMPTPAVPRHPGDRLWGQHGDNFMTACYAVNSSDT